MQKFVKMYKDGGAKIFQKSLVNQPKQGHQPWQSNSLYVRLSVCARAFPGAAGSAEDRRADIDKIDIKLLKDR